MKVWPPSDGVGVLSEDPELCMPSGRGATVLRQAAWLVAISLKRLHLTAIERWVDAFAPADRQLTRGPLTGQA